MQLTCQKVHVQLEEAEDHRHQRLLLAADLVRDLELLEALELSLDMELKTLCRRQYASFSRPLYESISRKNPNICLAFLSMRVVRQITQQLAVC